METDNLCILISSCNITYIILHKHINFPSFKTRKMATGLFQIGETVPRLQDAHDAIRSHQLCESTWWYGGAKTQMVPVKQWKNMES